MASSTTSCVNPSSLSLPSPVSDAPSPESSDSHSAGPSRKRQRSDVTSEERKEARAHRNRIAAQNSRDRRKAHFSYLERRVNELEEENRQLRAGMGIPDLHRSEAQVRENARDKENEELRERIKTLEKGWDAVVKALAAQGLPTGLPVPRPSSPEPAVPQEASTSSPQPPQSPSAFPVLVPPPTAFTQPSPSNTSSSSDVFPDDLKSTRHLARVATTVPSVSLQRVDSQRLSPPSPTDAIMDALLREILAPDSPSMSSSASIPLDSALFEIPVTTSSPASSATLEEVQLDWESEAEMQRLLDMLPNVGGNGLNNEDDDKEMINVQAVDFPSALDLELGSGMGWDMESGSAGIGVF